MDSDKYQFMHIKHQRDKQIKIVYLADIKSALVEFLPLNTRTR